MNAQRHLTIAIAAFAILAVSMSTPAALLTPSSLGAHALWTGSAGGFLTASDIIELIDGNPATLWRADQNSSPNACVTLSSPLPFIVDTVEVVISTHDATRSAGTIEIMPVGRADFISTTVSIDNGENGGDTVTLTMPSEYQVPISAIRYNGGYWTELNELSFYGQSVAPLSFVTDLTATGTQYAVSDSDGSDNVEDPSGVFNGVLESDATGYHVGGGTHDIYVDFGGTAQRVDYIALNPNTYWKEPWAAIGTESLYTSQNDLSLFSSYTPATSYTDPENTDAPGHSWIVLPVDNTMLYAAGVRIDDYWGDLSEIVILAVPEPATGTLVLLMGAMVLRRRRRG